MRHAVPARGGSNMNASWEEFEELQPLCEAAIEGRLTAEQLRRLEQLVLEHAEARRLYVEYVQQHASLRWSAAEPGFLPAAPPTESVVAPRSRFRFPGWRFSLAVSMAGMAA